MQVFLPSRQRTAIWLAVISWLLVAFAFCGLAAAFLRLDFSLLLVAKHSHSDLPAFYRLGAVWGNHEGSLLLWVLMLTTFGVGIAFSPLKEKLKVTSCAVHGAITFGFLCLLLFSSNPFVRLLPMPLDGSDLNPILQHPALMFHPPLLYLGYVGFSAAWSITVAALLAEGGLTKDTARVVRLWALVAWSKLTAGIALGSWWAYYELGWGGFWFWDPVENSALMPWLSGTALIHCLAISAKNGELRNWSGLTAITTFCLSLLGAFLVRSGILDSVHSFAQDPLRGLLILGLITLLCGGAFYIYFRTATDPKSTGSKGRDSQRADLGGADSGDVGSRNNSSGDTGSGGFSWFSRQWFLVLNNVLLLSFAATVLLGTLYPIFIKLLGLAPLTVGAPYFNLTGIVPLVLGSLAMIVLPHSSWNKKLATNLPMVKALFGYLALGLVITHLAGLVNGILATGLVAVLMAVILATSASYLRALVTLRRVKAGKAGKTNLLLVANPKARVHAMHLAHMAVAGLLMATTIASFGRVERPLTQQQGESVQVAGGTVVFEGTTTHQGVNYAAQQGQYTLKRKPTTPDVSLVAENRFYPAAKVATVEAGVHSSFKGDFFITLGQGGDGFSRVVFQPWVRWIWIFAMVLVGCGILAVVGMRRR